MDKKIGQVNKNVPFTTWMIVYTPSKNRVANYNHINNIHPTNQFVAIDSVSNFKACSDFAIEKNYCTPEYIKTIRKHPGKLGCNLSHQLLMEVIANNSLTEWNLVLEDDTLIHIPMLLNEVQTMFQSANKYGSKFIQLYTHSRYRLIQSKRTKVGENLHKMMGQWGTCAYFIHKDAIPKIKEIYPLQRNIDFVYGSLTLTLKSLCWLTPYVKTIGEADGCSRDKTANMGSIIMSRNGTGDFSVENAYEEFDEFLRKMVLE